MIYLCGKYYLDANSSRYTLRVGSRKKNGKMVYKPCTYHSRLEEALAEAVRRTIRDGVASGELKEWEQLRTEFQKLECEMRGLLQSICSARMDEKSSVHELAAATENKCA